jgi:PQQ-dependent dehydrogenase (methanol/ethanol family)
MPKQAPNSLPTADYVNLTAFLLIANGYKPGSTVAPGQSLTELLPSSGKASQAAEIESTPFPAPPIRAGVSQGSAPTDAELLHPADSDWLMFNRSYAGDRFSPLSQINTGTAVRLQPACLLQLGVLGSFQSSPLVYKGTGFVGSAYGVYAFDAATCIRKWTYTYTPTGPEGFPTSRGIAFYDGKIFRGTPDAHLIALDAETGNLVWDVHVADGARGYGVTAAPVIFKGKVIVGLAGGDYGANGHVYAFDARTGEKLWAFDTIERKSWPKGAEVGGGATWTTVAVDPKDGLVFIPVGNPSPDYYTGSRPGGNLYSNSVVALDAATGKVAWYVQQIAGDYHDWDTAAAPVLYEQNGRRYMAVGNKAGYVYVYDRDTHKMVSRTSVVTRVNDEAPFTAKPLRVCPGSISGVEWNGPAYDPVYKALYVNSIEWCSIYTAKVPEGNRPGALYLEGDIAMDPPDKSSGWTRALDAATGAERWARPAPKPMVGAVTPTAGGVVLTGGGDGRFLVLDQRDGRVLYSFNTGGSIGGGVATYMVGDKQYVAVASGGFGLAPYGDSGAPTLVVFALAPDPVH